MRRGRPPGARRPQHGRAGAPAPEDRVELRIASLAAGGAGVGKIEGPAGAEPRPASRAGEVVFVPGTAPGDRVEVALDRGARPLRGRVLRLIEPSPLRVSPACPFVETCGGCDWMHLSVEAQQAAHVEIVRQAILRATGLGELPAIRVHAAPAPLGYRTRARLFARAERGVARVGYRAPGTHALAAIDRCVVLSDAIAPLVGELPEVLRGAKGEGDVLVARGAGGRPAVEIAWRGELAPATWQALDARVAAGAWAGARVTLEGASQAASFGDPRPVVTGADGAPLILAAGGFGQPSEEGAATLARRVAELARPEAARPAHVLELFAGSGTLSILLARGAPPAGAPASFTAVERAPEAALCLRENLAARGLAGKVIAADADRFDLPPRVDVCVLDPPRAGAPGAARALAASRVRTIVYVACDPATLARDLATLAGAGFSPTDLEIVELFPQTSHVETIARLSRALGSRR